MSNFTTITAYLIFLKIVKSAVNPALFHLIFCYIYSYSQIDGIFHGMIKYFPSYKITYALTEVKMGGFFGATCKRDVVADVFFGTDYHSHLGTKNAGMAIWSKDSGFQRQIHSISHSPFRSKFEDDLRKFSGTSGIGCISDSDPQPLLVRSHLGIYALTTVGAINNAEALVQKFFSDHSHQFMVMGSGEVNSTELVAALINQGENLIEGIKYANDCIDGSMTMLLLLADGSIIAARDKTGRLPIHIGKSSAGYSVAFESFAYQKLGYVDEYELGAGEIVKITPDSYETISPALPGKKICAFLWTYYGYPNSNYEGVNVEVMRYRNGAIMARHEMDLGILPDVDSVSGVPDSGVPHAMGFANASGKILTRPFVKYTPTWPRSFMPIDQSMRNQVAKMKQIPVPELIEGRRLLFVDDSIVRGTQLRETVEFLYGAGAKEVHMRSACPPIMYGCKYLNFSRSNSDQELIARRVIRKLEGEEGDKYIAEYSDSSTERGKCLLKEICSSFGFDSLGYQSIEGVLDAIGIDKETVCTYCWTGRE